MKSLSINIRGNPYFLMPLVEYWKKKKEWELQPDPQKADVIFLEWANEQCISMSKNTARKNIVCRVLGSEYYQEFWKQADPKGIHSFLIMNPISTMDGYHRTDYIPSTVDVNYWKPVSKKFITDKKTIGIVGSFIYNKGHFPLLQMIAEKPDYFDTVYFIGDNNENIRNQNDSIRALETRKIIKQSKYFAKEHGIKIHFTGQLNNEELRSYYSTLDYIVNNSVNEGCPASLSEALSCECRILVNDWPGARIHYTDANVFSYASDFWQLIDQKRFSKKECRQYAIDNFSLEVIMPKIDKILKECL